MPEVMRKWKIAGREPINPAFVAKTSESQGWPMDWWGKVNSVHCPRGRFPGEAHFLVDQDAKAAIGSAAVNITYTEFDFATRQSTEVTFTGYYLIRTQATSKDSSKPPHWVTLADRRWLLERSACNERYNLRKSKDAYIDETTNGGTPWTWAEIFAELWALLPGVAGSAPSLPITPGSTPENLIFEGIGTWRAINQILCAIGCVVILDPYEGAFTVEEAKATQAGLAGTKAANTRRLLWKYSATELPGTNYPSKAVVTFHGIPGDDTTMDPFHPLPEVEEAAVAGGSFGTGYPITDTMFHWDDNSAARAARAAELAGALEGLLKPLARPWGAVYAGLVEFSLGSELTDVTWISDGENGMRTIAKFSTSFIEFPEWVEPSIGGGGGELIEYTIDSMTISSEPDYLGLKKATVTVRGGPAALIGTSVDVYDHSGCIFDEEDMIDYTGWAFWGQYRTLDTEEECEVLTPFHWAAINRCCAAGSGTYRECA